MLFDEKSSAGLLERAVEEYVIQEEPLLDMIMEMFRKDLDFLTAFYITDDVLRQPDVMATGI